MRGIKTNVLAFPGIKMVVYGSDNHFFIGVTQMHFVNYVSRCKLDPYFSFLKESRFIAFFNVHIYALVLG